jgi:hypothetical protein
MLKFPTRCQRLVGTPYVSTVRSMDWRVERIVLLGKNVARCFGFRDLPFLTEISSLRPNRKIRRRELRLRRVVARREPTHQRRTLPHRRHARQSPVPPANSIETNGPPHFHTRLASISLG